MKIALIGYGKMGKEIEQVALASGHEIPLKIDVHNQNEFTAEKLRMVDVAIEFTTPQTVMGNITKVLQAGIPLVVGSTGWQDQLSMVTNMCIEKQGRFFHASNYSIGVNIFIKANKYLAKMMNSYPDYEVNMTEIHHTQKLDAPSGTAITLAESIIENMDRLKKWDLAKSGNTESLRIDAIRQFKVPGIHTVHYENDIDLIEFTHSAKSRKGFAVGAVKAAEFIVNQKPGIYSMEDLLIF